MIGTLVALGVLIGLSILVFAVMVSLVFESTKKAEHRTLLNTIIIAIGGSVISGLIAVAILGYQSNRDFQDYKDECNSRGGTMIKYTCYDHPVEMELESVRK